MTRINPGIDPIELCDVHLISEYREIGRVYRLAMNALVKDTDIESYIPKKFTLGTGHMKFFVNKGVYLYKRFKLIVAEMERRGFAVKCKWRAWPWPGRFNLDWIEPKYARDLTRSRINERLCAMKRKPKWTKCSRPEWSIAK